MPNKQPPKIVEIEPVFKQQLVDVEPVFKHSTADRPDSTMGGAPEIVETPKSPGRLHRAAKNVGRKALIGLIVVSPTAAVLGAAQLAENGAKELGWYDEGPELTFVTEEDTDQFTERVGQTIQAAHFAESNENFDLVRVDREN